jgi:hypothetical protein
MVTPRHNVKFPIIADSGANFHMFRDIEFFETLAPVAGNVILGDGKTSVPIQGVGSITLCLDGHIQSLRTRARHLVIGTRLFADTNNIY